jgi:hypothetical protein
MREAFSGREYRVVVSELRNIVVIPNREVPAFVCDDSFVAVTFVGSRHGSRTPPKLLRRVPRVIIRADDCYPQSSIGGVALTSTVADRIASFTASRESGRDASYHRQTWSGTLSIWPSLLLRLTAWTGNGLCEHRTLRTDGSWT